jgi:hypothetical protein
MVWSSDWKKMVKHLKRFDTKTLKSKVFRPSIRKPMVESLLPAVRSAAPRKTGRVARSLEAVPQSANRKKANLKYGYVVRATKYWAAFTEFGAGKQKVRMTRRPVPPWGRNRGRIQPPMGWAKKVFRAKRNGIKRRIELTFKINLDRLVRRTFGG